METVGALTGNRRSSSPAFEEAGERERGWDEGALTFGGTLLIENVA